MRHFVALAPPPLAPGVVHAATKTPLVALAGAPHALPPRLPGARPRAVPLPVITSAAYPQQLLTACAVEQTVTVDTDPQIQPLADQGWTAAADRVILPALVLAGLVLRFVIRGASQKARGSYPGPSLFRSPHVLYRTARTQRNPRRMLCDAPASIEVSKQMK